MIIPGRWQAFIAAIALTLLAPHMPPGMAGFFLILTSAFICIRMNDLALPLALFILGVLSFFGFVPAFVLCATVLIVATRELIFFYSGGRPVEYALAMIGGLLVTTLVIFYMTAGTWLSAVVGVTVAILLYAILQKKSYAITGELIGVAMAMLLLENLEFQADLPLVATAAFISFGFAYFAYRLKTADIAGLFSAALVGILLIVFAGISWFMIMLAFFILGAAATRYQMEYKKSLHVEQESGGVRGYINVFANGLVSVVAAVCFGVSHHPVFIAVYLGSVATAASDTVAGEIGVCSGRPYLITTLKPVDEGTNGGVSLTGEIAGLFAAVFIGACAVLLGVADIPVFIACVAGGLIGANIDSLIGEVLENKKVIGNAGTNFLATLGGGVVTALLWVVLIPVF
ncbi:MAG TPA: TIGR00297 family protein [Methanospirillum sp.]|uniref:TIGR00297 family protein n=1 Tax=Methanospirillum sp. TaxID=45200 RepID=UPI002D169581|nr:TIGR00297 family protein [Methanospirillum sp.]HWQ63212.1 TIGR00297 family protein [Methanospirillum sp.]